MTDLALSRQVFAILSGLVEARAGLHYAESDRELLAAKVAPLALELGFDSLLDYYYFLRYDPGGDAALDALVDALVVHETYFFREPEPLRLLVDEVLAPAVAAGRRPRVWCAACATGEEALTLAMLLDERGLLARVELLATDISERALSRARRGVYGPRSLRALPPGVLGRWLERDGEQAVVKPALRDAIAWRKINLVDPQSVAAEGRFDAILCRNVLIYFADATASRVVAALTDALVPGGMLLVGVSESLLRFGTRLRCEERRGVFAYLKEGDG